MLTKKERKKKAMLFITLNVLDVVPYLVLVLLHYGELSLQLLQHLELRRLQVGPITP